MQDNPCLCNLIHYKVIIQMTSLETLSRWPRLAKKAEVKCTWMPSAACWIPHKWCSCPLLLRRSSSSGRTCGRCIHMCVHLGRPADRDNVHYRNNHIYVWLSPLWYVGKILKLWLRRYDMIISIYIAIVHIVLILNYLHIISCNMFLEIKWQQYIHCYFIAMHYRWHIHHMLVGTSHSSAIYLSINW